MLRIILRKKRKLFVSLFLLCTLAACVLYVAGYISHDLIMKDPILGTRIMLSSSFMYFPGFGLLIYWINLSGPITVLLFSSPIFVIVVGCWINAISLCYHCRRGRPCYLQWC